MAPVNPIIFVPGITASYLRDDYQVPPEHVWTVLRKKYERIMLHPNNLKYEAIQPARIQPGQVYEVAYREFIEEIRSNLPDNEDEEVPVFPFAYDWRQPLSEIEKQLNDFIKEVIERTGLLRHYDKADYMQDPKVNLIGHSMGGLIISGYLQRYKKRARVGKVVTLATPFQGSFEAIVKVITGTANLGATVPSSRERKSARVTPSLYHLIPSFGDYGFLYDPACWQPSVVSTIRDYIEQWGLPVYEEGRTRPLPTSKAAKKIFSALLQEAKHHRNRTDRFSLAQAGLTKKSWLAVLGADAVTRIRISVEGSGGKRAFQITSRDRLNEWDKTAPELKILTGDGTVPLEGATPTFLDKGNLVVVTPDDFGYWEIKDKALTKLGGFHGILPNMNMIHRLVVRFLKEIPDKYGNTWGRSYPGVSQDEWDPPLNLSAKS